jgi:chromosome segregation ATPase
MGFRKVCNNSSLQIFSLQERDDAIKEIHESLHKSQQDLDSKSQELETKSHELREMRAKLEEAATPQRNLSEEAELQFRQLEQELRTAKEALIEMQRQAGRTSRESSAEVI